MLISVLISFYICMFAKRRFCRNAFVCQLFLMDLYKNQIILDSHNQNIFILIVLETKFSLYLVKNLQSFFSLDLNKEYCCLTDTAEIPFKINLLYCCYIRIKWLMFNASQCRIISWHNGPVVY